MHTVTYITYVKFIIFDSAAIHGDRCVCKRKSTSYLRQPVRGKERGAVFSNSPSGQTHTVTLLFSACAEAANNRTFYCWNFTPSNCSVPIGFLLHILLQQILSQVQVTSVVDPENFFSCTRLISKLRIRKTRFANIYEFLSHCLIIFCFYTV